jgi:transcriptional regulator GlxA family with amidase domain
MAGAHRVGVLAFDGVTLLDVSGPAEVLGKAAELGAPYEVVLLSPAGGEVTSSVGIRMSGTLPAASAGPLDTIVVAGADRLPGAVIEEELLAAAGALAAAAPRVASVCTGAFVLAALGLLDGRRATTHWRHASRLARQYPKVAVEPNAIFIRDGHVVTSAGVSAGIDLTLALVEHDQGAALARDVARELVVFLQRPGGQSQFSAAMQSPVPTSAVVRALQERVVADPARDHSPAALAAAAAVSPRHLSRLFHQELGTTPARWVEGVRLEAAQRLLLAGHSVTSAAARSGLGSDETLRRAFARHVGTTPTEYRDRFASTDPRTPGKPHSGTLRT